MDTIANQEEWLIKAAKAASAECPENTVLVVLSANLRDGGIRIGATCSGDDLELAYRITAAFMTGYLTHKKAPAETARPH